MFKDSSSCGQTDRKNLQKFSVTGIANEILYLSVNQALRICLEWSSETIYFSTHQFELIHNKIILIKNNINSLLAKSLRIFLNRHFLAFVNLGGLAPQHT